MKLYFMGICGTAMGNVAILMKQLGHEVCGADSGVYPPMSTILAEAGIDVYEGFDPVRLEKVAPELVVIGNAMSRGQPELEWLLDTRALPVVSLPELISRELLPGRQSIVIAGTHGKTTTTALTAALLRANGSEPGWLVGGVPRDLPRGAKLGTPGAPFVIEGDEYDSAFFDKRSKFIHYQPQLLVLNNLEFDHGDIFRDLEDVKRSFRHVIRLVPRSGYILYNADDPNLAELLPVEWTRCLSVGTSKHADLRVRDFVENREGSSFSLRWPSGQEILVHTCLPGLYNAHNVAMAALACGLALNAEKPEVLALDILADYHGVKRRQDILLDQPELVVIEDFGHHPTALRETLASLRARYPQHRLTACFEPRSNTACTAQFQDAFTEALALADACYLAPVYRAERYADDERLDTEAMAATLTARGTCSGAFNSFDTLIDELIHATETKRDRPRCVVVFSNGAFGGKLPHFVERFAG
ncbi:MAG: Mur ligase family protein [Verrucomicrobiota bacterium]